MRSILMIDLCSTVTLEPLCITLKLKVHNVGGHVIATQSVEIDHYYLMFFGWWIILSIIIIYSTYTKVRFENRL